MRFVVLLVALGAIVALVACSRGGPEASDPKAAAVPEVTSWGAFGPLSLARALAGAANLVALPDSLPGVVSDLARMLVQARAFDQDVGGWNVRRIQPTGAESTPWWPLAPGTPGFCHCDSPNRSVSNSASVLAVLAFCPLGLRNGVVRRPPRDAAGAAGRQRRQIHGGGFQ